MEGVTTDPQRDQKERERVCVCACACVCMCAQSSLPHVQGTSQSKLKLVCERERERETERTAKTALSVPTASAMRLGATLLCASVVVVSVLTVLLASSQVWAWRGTFNPDR